MKVYFRQLISALEFIHQAGVSHRDLKPENLLIDHENNIKVGDFGLSILICDGRGLKTSCGSPNYAAPELLNGEIYDGCSSDMWSAGVILYASLMGTLPFDSHSLATLFDRIKKAKYYLPSKCAKLNPEARDLIVRLL